VAVIALLAGCANLASPPKLPPITAGSTGQELAGKFVWFDLLTPDMASAQRFYGELFGWSFDTSQGPRGYAVIRHDGIAIGGMAKISGQDAEEGSIWLPSLSVADVDQAARITRERGGEVLDGPVDVSGRGRMAVLRDPAGAELVALRSDTGDPPDAEPSLGRWLWTDLFTNDGEASNAFYAALVDYRAKDIETGEDHVYRVLGRDGRARAGIVEIHWKYVDPNWLPYVRVADVTAATRAAESLGGKLLLRVEQAAILTDPSGAAIGVQRTAKGGK
jgi:hypothetical protein